MYSCYPGAIYWLALNVQLSSVLLSLGRYKDLDTFALIRKITITNQAMLSYLILHITKDYIEY